MSEDILKYTPELDLQIAPAVSQVLSVNVKSTSRIEKGEYNHVFKAELDTGPVIVRVFRHRHWPEEDKLSWVEEQLQQKNVPHARVLYHSRESKFFKNGFMVSEFIEGENARDAINSGKITSDFFYQGLGVLLNQIHDISLPKFGEVNAGRGEDASFYDEVVRRITKSTEKIGDALTRDKLLFANAQGIALQIFKQYEGKFTPTLIHGDATGKNTILTQDMQLILIDWDNVRSAPGIQDLTWDTFWCSDMLKGETWAEKRKWVHDSFFQTYQLKGLSIQEFLEIERAMHIWQALDLLQYYKDSDNRQAHEGTIKKLQELVYQ